MSDRFGDFELDRECRELRLRGESVPLQPRVFDLLALLYQNRHRVMTKDELLDALWPGVVVGDGSLQRAVSLARSALRKGGLGDAIRNYARQGYRLCVGGECPPADEHLQAARMAVERGDWDAAIDAYQRADVESPLQAADLERFAEAFQCAGRAADSEPVLERAAAACSAKGDCRGAARAALRLAEIAFEAARMPVARGWLTRGCRYLQGLDETWEHGLAAYVSARMTMASGEPEASRTHARRCVDIGQRLGSDEIEALGRLYLGYAELTLGRVDEGMSLIDEAAAAVLAGNVGPWAGGIVYCGLIWVCCNRGDWQRAAQWSDSFSRWCERSGLTRFSGLCQLHRAEVLSVSGEVADAEAEIRKACEQLSRYSPFAEGEAFRIMGELKLLRGELDAAEDAFRRAHELGWDPQPGLAMLQAARGESEAAIRSLLRSLDEPNWALQQRRGLLLAQLVIIAARRGDRDRARQTMAELDANPGLWTSEFHGATVARARAELAALEGRHDEAVAAMREAIRSWQAARATLNVACCRLRLAEMLAEEGDKTGALLELDAAQSSFDAMDAPRQVEASAALRDSVRDVKDVAVGVPLRRR